VTDRARTDVAAHDHPTAQQLQEHAAGRTRSGLAWIGEHLTGCVACRVWAVRAAAASDDPPAQNVLARLVSAAPRLPEPVRQCLAAPSDGAPQPGELWRASRDNALLVWIRRVLDGAIAVVPAVLDTDLADEQSVLVDAEYSPVGEPLALMLSVEGHVDPGFLLGRIGVLDATAAVDEIRAARQEGRAPRGVRTGPAVTSEYDERLEYRQLLADLLQDLAPGAADDDEEETPDGPDLLNLADELDALPLLRWGCKPAPAGPGSVQVGELHWLRVEAEIRELDLVVLVAVLTGPTPLAVQTSEAAARACGALRNLFPEADDVAIAVADPAGGWKGVVVAGPYTTEAFEPPGGGTSGPRVPGQPMALVDALLKHFDAHAGVGAGEDPVALERAVADITSTAAAASRAAAERTSRTRAVTPEKKVGYGSPGAADAARTEAFLLSVASGADPAAAVQELLGQAPS
jgi:hypothetical protein